jgi:hypothetical protein
MGLLTPGNPVNNVGTLTLLAGCDYKSADGNAAIWTNAKGTWPSLSGASVYLAGYRGNQQIPMVVPPGTITNTCNPSYPLPIFGPVSGTVTAGTQGSLQSVSFDIANSYTALTPCPSTCDTYSYGVFAKLSNGDIVGLFTGRLVIVGVAT